MSDTGASPLVLPSNPRRVGLYYSPVLTDAHFFATSGNVNNNMIWSSAGSTQGSPLDLDFVRHGPIVQGPITAYDGDSNGSQVVVETVLDDDLSNIIQKEGI